MKEIFSAESLPLDIQNDLQEMGNCFFNNFVRVWNKESNQITVESFSLVGKPDINITIEIVLITLFLEYAESSCA